MNSATLMPTTPAASTDHADWREVRMSGCPAGCKVHRSPDGGEAVIHLPVYGCGTSVRVVPVTLAP